MLHIGFQNYINKNKILAITNSDSHPLIQVRRKADNRGKFVNCAQGRKVKSLVHLQGGVIVASFAETETLRGRWRDENKR